MDKSAIKNFAIEARKILMKSAISEAGLYGVTKEGCKPPLQKGNDFEIYETIAGTQNRIFGADIKKRANLVQAIEQQGFDQVIEETAYTWFNRIIAIRFMEVNNYLPSRVRVLSSETGSNIPDIVAHFDTVDLNMTEEELQKVRDTKNDNKYDEAFRQLFVKQCNELNDILPGLFEKTNDYMELLLKLSYTGDGVVRMLVDTIPEDNFNVETEGQVEIIGWMYQYYNTELKDDTFAKLKKNIKITKERIPAVTQLFTPDWIVRYMVENSVGRVWIEHLRAVDSSVDEKAKAEEFGWKYYLPEAEQDAEVTEKLVEIRKDYANLEPKDITCIDPCMGSGHILVYMFDVLMDIYRSEGYNERDAVFDILQSNICGLDIDKRAYQLSYFALMMKARGYNRLFFKGYQNEEGERELVNPEVYVIEQSNEINRAHLKYFGSDLEEFDKNTALNQIYGLLDQLIDAKEYGSIIDIDKYDWKLLARFASDEETSDQISFETVGIQDTKKKLLKLVKQGEVMGKKYWVVSTNPPYMVLSNGNDKLSSFVKKNYPNSKADLFAVFIQKSQSMLVKSGINAMITMHSWMFINSFENLRRELLKEELLSLVHLGIKAFEEIGNDVVQTCSFVFRNTSVNNKISTFVKLDEIKNYIGKQDAFIEHSHELLNNIEKFLMVPSYVFAYWVENSFFENFKLGKRIEDFSVFTGSQNITGDNESYLRCFWEVNNELIGKKWVPYAKGGDYRQYYGNIQMVVNWSDEARLFYKSNKTSNLLAPELWYKEGITYSAITSRGTGFRYLPEGCIFDKGGPSINVKNRLLELLALLNSSVAKYYFWVFNPSINLQVKDIKNFPIILGDTEEIELLAKANLEIAKQDWDSRETSIDFTKNPLINSSGKLSDIYENWSNHIEEQFKTLQNNEIKINKVFIDLYNMHSVSPIVEDREVSVRLPEVSRDIQELVSYAVGCMFGRYSLDEDGIIYAGGIWDVTKYSKYVPDTDGIIPILDDEYFQDDIVTRFVEFIELIYGTNTLETNLAFIAKALGTKGSSDREKIRNYFLNDFYKDHCSMYSITGTGKRPIYWLFDSGKENGFKCLIYIHRYNRDTVGLIRSDYLIKTQDAVENARKNAEYIIQTSNSAVDKARATKKRDKYIRQLAEMRNYYQALSHVALQRIEIDLDDGVKKNYSKFQSVEISIEGEKKQTIDLLAKI